MSLIRLATFRLAQAWNVPHGEYERYLDRMVRENRGNRDLAFARAVGAENLELYREQGDGHVAVLRHHGLADGMSIFDLGCGSGRTAQALQRFGWQGRYQGSDVVERFIPYLREKCPGYEAVVNDATSIPVADASLDMIFHWSVFTHVPPEECYLSLADSFRALKPGGKLVFSFLEFEDPGHRIVFESRLDRLKRGKKLSLPDNYLHRDWLELWAREIGFSEPNFTDGSDGSHHPPFWQSIAVMPKPV